MNLWTWIHQQKREMGRVWVCGRWGSHLWLSKWKRRRILLQWLWSRWGAFCLCTEQGWEQQQHGTKQKHAGLSKISLQTEQVSHTSRSVAFRCSNMQGSLSVRNGVSDTAVLNFSASAFLSCRLYWQDVMSQMWHWPTVFGPLTQGCPSTQWLVWNTSSNVVTVLSQCVSHRFLQPNVG